MRFQWLGGAGHLRQREMVQIEVVVAVDYILPPRPFNRQAALPVDQCAAFSSKR